MIDALPLLLSDEGYQISRSVRLRSSATGYFERNLTTPTNNRIWTWIGWVKRGQLGTNQNLFGTTDNNLSSGNVGRLQFTSTNKLEYFEYSSAYTLQLLTTQVFRDPSAWYHIAFLVDTTQATASNRVRIFVNGVQVTVFDVATYPTQNYNPYFNSAITHYLGAYRNTSSGILSSLDGYLTEINFIDGQALTPSSFGETNTTTGVWQPKKYAGTYGTNGFYLNFSDNSAATAAAIGKDNSGNGNNWTPNNISVTAGVTYDSMLDVPTQWADGGNGRGNYCVLNPLDKAASATVSNGNLRVTSGSATALGSRGTFQIPTTGKWYYEAVVVNTPSGSAPIEFGSATDASSLTTLQATGAYGIYVSTAVSYMNNGTATGSLGSLTAGDIIQFAGDCDNSRIWIGKNNVYWDASSGTTGNPSTNSNPTLSVNPASMFPLYLAYNNSLDANFGQRPFSYTPPTGFRALNTLNLPQPTILKGNQFFDATVYTGSTSTNNIVNAGGMQPDLVWVKSRSQAYSHYLYDAVRGTGAKALSSNTTGVEGADGTAITSFNSNGFTFTGNSGANDPTFSNGYVGWQWKEGATQGFDIVTYTGNGANRTVAHSLGVAPRMVIVKRRTGVDSWPVYHANLTSAANTLILNSTAAQQTVATYWNSTAPTSSVFSVGTDSAVNASSNDYVAYLFSEVAGFSKAFSYTGNASSDGPFIFCGFRPRFILAKSASTAGTNWFVIDTARSPENVSDEWLLPNGSNAEQNQIVADILSNGFKIRNSTAEFNTSGSTYIGFAFAEVPYKNSLAR
jgi:hypothetical protein